MTGRKPLISADRLAKIRSRVPMPALVAEGVAVQRAGRGEYLAVCPFHAEQTPSFRVYSDHAHCFGCGWHGDQIRWLMDHDHLGFLGERIFVITGGQAVPQGDTYVSTDSGPIKTFTGGPIAPPANGVPIP